MSYLNFIDDQKLENIVHEVLQKGRDAQAKSDHKLGANVIDPFSLLLEMGSLSIDLKQWLENERTRQAQKTLSNHIGFFHQNILGALDGWKNLGAGEMVDIVSHSKKIIREVKNKHNTIKGSDKSGMYYRLEDLVMRKGHKYKDYTAYYIEIVPKNPIRYNKPFMPSDSRTGARCPLNSLIRTTDGYSFYALATGVDDALCQLFSALPAVIAKIRPGHKIADIEPVKEFFKKAYS